MIIRRRLFIVLNEHCFCFNIINFFPFTSSWCCCYIHSYIVPIWYVKFITIPAVACFPLSPLSFSLLYFICSPNMVFLCILTWFCIIFCGRPYQETFDTRVVMLLVVLVLNLSHGLKCAALLSNLRTHAREN